MTDDQIAELEAILAQAGRMKALRKIEPPSSAFGLAFTQRWQRASSIDYWLWSDILDRAERLYASLYADALAALPPKASDAK